MDAPEQIARPALEAGVTLVHDASIRNWSAVDAGPPVSCTRDEDCRGHGRRYRCFTTALAAQYTQAFATCPDGAQWRTLHTEGTCIFDECRDDPHTPEETCPSGMRCGTLDMVPFPQRICLPAECANDRSCQAHGSGQCLPFLAAGRCRPGGWGCSYAGDPCIPRSPSRRCPVVPGMLPFCVPRDGRFSCEQVPVVQ